MNFAKFLRTPFLQKTSGRLLLNNLPNNIQRHILLTGAMFLSFLNENSQFQKDIHFFNYSRKCKKIKSRNVLLLKELWVYFNFQSDFCNKMKEKLCYYYSVFFLLCHTVKFKIMEITFYVITFRILAF